MAELRKLGSEIRSIRGALTQHQFAEILEISQGSVAKYENGRAMPRASILVQMAELGQISVEDLLIKADLTRSLSKSGQSQISTKYSSNGMTGHADDLIVSFKKISDLDYALGELVAKLMKAFLKTSKNPKLRIKCREAAENALKAIDPPP